MDTYLVENFTNGSAGNATFPGNAGFEALSLSTQVAIGLVAGFSSCSLILNCFLLFILVSSKVREQSTGMQVLTVMEILLSLALLVLFISMKVVKDPSRLPQELGLGVHAVQMARNYWLLAVTLHRMAITVRPQLAAHPNHHFRPRHQLFIVCLIVCMSLLTLLARKPSLTGGSSSVATEQQGAAVQDDLVAYIRLYLAKSMSFAALGVMLPGVAILAATAKIAHGLHYRLVPHRATNRVTKMVLTLSIGFLLLESPLAVSYAATCGYLLNSLTLPLDQSHFDTLQVLEQLATWGMAFVPLDSCLNFLVLLRYSRPVRCFLRSSTQNQRRRWQLHQHRSRRRKHRKRLEQQLRQQTKLRLMLQKQWEREQQTTGSGQHCHLYRARRQTPGPSYLTSAAAAVGTTGLQSGRYD